MALPAMTAATSAGHAATMTVSLLSDSTANLATSPTTHFATSALAEAAFIAAGTTLVCVALPQGNYERYLGVKYTVGTENLTAGKFDAYLTLDPAGANRKYKSGFAVA